MEEFVQSSGEHGVIVFTLGSMVHSLSDEKSNVIAKALSQLPQKVNFFLSLKQVALFFSLLFMFGAACSLPASLLDVIQPGSWALSERHTAEFLHGEFWCFTSSEPNDTEVCLQGKIQKSLHAFFL